MEPDDSYPEPEQLAWDSLAKADPLEDVGAATQARYRYQYEVVARDVIRVLTREVSFVICEWYEDSILIYPTGAVELLSVKHREPSRGAWTRHDLIVNGGLKHLFGRWKDTGRRATCRVATNAGLRSDATALRDTCARGEATELSALAGKLRTDFEDTTEELPLFLAGLRIEDGLPQREHMNAWCVQALVRPTLKGLRLKHLAAEDVFDAIVDTVALASRDGPTTGSHEFLDVVADPAQLKADGPVRRRCASRTVAETNVRLALERRRPTQAPRLVAPRPGTTETALEQKLARGGVGPTAIENAKRLRANWTVFQAEYDDPMGEWRGHLENLAARIGREAAIAEGEAKATTGDGKYGLAMQQRLRDRLPAALAGLDSPLPLDEALLEALTYEMTDLCEVWWSPKFVLRRRSGVSS